MQNKHQKIAIVASNQYFLQNPLTQKPPQVYTDRPNTKTKAEVRTRKSSGFFMPSINKSRLYGGRGEPSVSRSRSFLGTVSESATLNCVVSKTKIKESKMTNKQRPIAIVASNQYFLRLKYFLLGYRLSVRPVGKNPYRENQKRKASPAFGNHPACGTPPKEGNIPLYGGVARSAGVVTNVGV